MFLTLITALVIRRRKRLLSGLKLVRLACQELGMRVPSERRPETCTPSVPHQHAERTGAL